MPGYELNRFTKSSKVEVKELLCTICGDVYCSPLQTKCCTKLFCESCIREWIISNRSCPFDSQPLATVEELQAAPESLLTLLGKQKLKCTFATKGCTEVVSVEGIVEHERYCAFDKQPCNSGCGFMGTSEHNCLKALIEYKSIMAQVLASMRKERAEVVRYNGQNVRSLACCRATIKDISRELSAKAAEEAAKQAKQQPTPPSDQQQQQSSASVKEKCSSPSSALVRIANNEELLAEAKRQLWLGSSITIDGRRSKKELVERVFQAAKEALTSGCNTVQEVVRAVKAFGDGSLPGNWSCYLLERSQALIAHNVQSDSYVEVKLGKQVALVLYKATDPYGFNRILQAVRTGAIRDFTAIKSGFEHSATREIEKVVSSGLKGTSSLDKEKDHGVQTLSNKAAAALTANYGGNWYCFLYKGSLGFFNVRALKDNYCILSTGDLKMLVFQL